jgi:hypothetical protein
MLIHADGLSCVNILSAIASPRQQANRFPQTPSSTMYAISDPQADLAFEVPHIKLLKATMTIAQVLGCQEMMWDPNTRWTFNPPHAVLLPPNLQPTEAQRHIPHHPIFDILPWPSVRTKLISMFGLPPELRHPTARDSEALIHLAEDIEDTSEGFRVHGSDGLSDEAWEIGEAFYKNWWWA